VEFRDLFEFMDSSSGHHTLPAKESLDEVEEATIETNKL